MRRIAENRRAPGFTLVEVVVALTVLSLIMLATVGSLRTFGNTQVSLERMTSRVDEVRTLSTLLRDLVESATLGESADGLTLGGGARTSSYWRGDEASLTWRARVMFGENYGGQYLLRLAPEEGSLVLRWREAVGNLSSDDWSEEPAKMLVAELDEMEVAFLPQDGERWQPSWDEGSPPDLLRLRIRASGRYWPDLVMQVPR